MQTRCPALFTLFVVAFAIGLCAQACADRPSSTAPSTPTVVPALTIAVEKPSPTLAAQREVQPLPPTPIPPPPGIVWTTSTSPDGAWRARHGSIDGLDAPPSHDNTQPGDWSYSSLAIESVDGQHTITVEDGWANYTKCAPTDDFLGWSPDGANAFAASSWPCSGGCNNPVGSTHRIVRIALADQRIDRLFEATAESPTVHGRVALSPDRRWIALREDAPDHLFAIRLMATGDEADRTAAFDFRASMFPAPEAVWIEGPWSIEWLPDSAAVRFNYTTGICTQMPSTEGWLRYDLVTGALVPDGPVSTGVP